MQQKLNSVFFYFCLLAIISTRDFLSASEWKKTSKKESIRILKSIPISKIQKSNHIKWEKFEEKKIIYSLCEDSFPKFPGMFPCSLMQDFSAQNEKAEIALPSGSSGELILKIFPEKNELGGKVAFVGEIEDSKRSNEGLTLFYDESGRLRYYFYQNVIVYFFWTQKGNQIELESAIAIRTSENKKNQLEPRVIKSIQF